MSEPSASPSWFPIPTLPPLVAWTVEVTGCISRFTGPAAALAPMGADRIVGQHYAVALGGTSVVDGIPVALSGRTVASIFVGWGRQWFTMLQPEFNADGSVLRAHGTSFVLPEGVDTRAPTEDFEAWVCVRSLRTPRRHIHAGDVVTREGSEYTWGARVPAGEAVAILRRHASAFRPADPQHGQRDEPAPPPSSRPPNLQILP